MKNENIIVIEKKKLFKDTALWQGFKKVDYSFYENINNNYWRCLQKHNLKLSNIML